MPGHLGRRQAIEVFITGKPIERGGKWGYLVKLECGHDVFAGTMNSPNHRPPPTHAFCKECPPKDKW